jgi:hypothetical protein
MSTTTASDFQISLEDWRQLCADAVSLARLEGEQEFAHKMARSAKEYGLRAFVTGPQMSWLARIADRVPPMMKRVQPQVSPATKVAGVPYTQLRQHRCNWPDCSKMVASSMWGCIEHWRRLPQDLRATLWKAFSDMDGPPTPEYLAAFEAIQEWIRANKA